MLHFLDLLGSHRMHDARTYVRTYFCGIVLYWWLNMIYEWAHFARVNVFRRIPWNRLLWMIYMRLEFMCAISTSDPHVETMLFSVCLFYFWFRFLFYYVFCDHLAVNVDVDIMNFYYRSSGDSICFFSLHLK